MINFIKKRYSYLIPIALIATVVIVWTQLLKPTLIHFIKQQIPKINSSQSFVEVNAGELDLSILTLQASVFDLHVKFKQDQIKLEDIRIEEAHAQLDLFNLLIGVPRLNKLELRGLKSEFTIPKDESNSPPPLIPVQKIFELTEQIPINHFLIIESKVNLKSVELNEIFALTVPALKISNEKTDLEIETANLAIETSAEKGNPITAQVDLNLAADKNKLVLNQFLFKIRESEISANAEFENYSELLRAPDGKFETSSRINLHDIRDIVLTLFPQKERFPSISGKVDLNGTIRLKTFNQISGDLQAKTSQVVLDHFKLGQAEVKAGIKNNQIIVNEIGLEHPAGAAVLKNIKIEQKSPYKFSATAEFNNFDLQKLFVSIGLNEIPAGLIATGVTSCDGLAENLIVSCKVDTGFENVWVKAGKKADSYIVKLRKGRIKGDLNVNSERVNFDSQIELGNNSSGLAKGSVEFKNGFNIDFESGNLDFADVETLAGLDLSGVLKIIGNTSGDSSKGIITADISATNAEIEKFQIGSFSSNLSYRAGHLNFENLLAVIGKSELAGELKFNFIDSNLNAKIKSNSFFGEDLMFVLKKRFELNFDLFGEGKIAANVFGPFNFWKLKYDVSTELKQGLIAGERFEKLNAELNSDGNKIDFKNVRVQKSKSILGVSGAILTESQTPIFDLKLKFSPLQLEESDYILKYAPSIAGTGYSDGEVTGPIDNPNLTTNITLKQVTYDKVEYPNSQGRLSINKNNFSFNGQFFGRQIQTDVVWPWDANQPFYTKVLVRDLNPLFLLPLISLPQPGSDFYSRLNGEMDLSGRTRSMSKTDGFVKISDFLIQRGNQVLKLEKPSALYFKNGLKEMDQLNLIGETGYLKLRLDPGQNSNKVRLNIDADLQLRLLHFLVPFTQSLSGNLIMNSQFIFKENGIELLGEGEISDGSIALKGFPQAIQNIHAPIEFSKSKILFNDITAQLGASDISGIGQVEILGPQNIAVNLKALADSVQLEFPKKVMTQGRANVLFSGNWLPYNLKVDYKVNQGLVTSDFETDNTQASNLKASSFLPPQQVQLLSPSLTLDINIDATNGILIKNKLLEGEAKGNLQIQGTPEQPIMIGKINITPGSKLVFKDKPFEIQNAAIQFQGTKEINPDIYISASSRVSDYDISLLVQGLARNLNITPTSQPPLSTNDIFTLLALGVTNQGNQNLSSDTQQRQTGLEVLAAISNQSQLNKKIQEKLGLTLQLAPSVDSTKNIAVPKVVVSKKISKKINASYSKPFTGNDQNQEVKLQYLYNNNVSFQLNYQNVDTTDQEQITNTNNNTNKSILGLDLEYRDEFK